MDDLYKRKNENIKQILRKLVYGFFVIIKAPQGSGFNFTKSKAEEIEAFSFIFTKEFQKFDTNIVIKELKEKGYFSFTNALTKKAARKIEQDSTESKLTLNNNKISGLHYERQYFFTNLLTTSKEFYDFVTSKFVFSICKKYLGNTFRLKCQRYYETHGGHHMQWHTDNKDATGPASVPGLIFIFYTSDVNDGQLQYIEGSHTWSDQQLIEITVTYLLIIKIKL